MKQGKKLPISLPSLSQTTAKPRAPPSVACIAHTDPLICRGVCLLQWYVLQHTRPIGRLPKNEPFHIAHLLYPPYYANWLHPLPLLASCRRISIFYARGGGYPPSYYNLRSASAMMYTAAETKKMPNNQTLVFIFHITRQSKGSASDVDS